MSRILTHVHIYYPEFWPEIKMCLGSMATDTYDLYVTTVKDYPELTKDVHSIKPDAQCLTMPNLGYDVGPFFEVLNQVDLQSYDYVIKLHTKRDMPEGARLNGFNMSGNLWRKYALSFISSQKNFKECLDVFEKDPDVGTCAHHRLSVPQNCEDKVATKHCIELLKQMGQPVEPFRFVAGTMFIMRAQLLKPLQALGLGINNFTAPVTGKPTSLAHSMERLFGALNYAQGKRIYDPFAPMDSQRRSNILRYWLKFSDFAYRKKITRNGKAVIKVFKIPVYRG